VSSNVHTALSRNDWHPDLAHDLPSQWVQGDPNIDDPVNDTGLGLRCGDFQVSGDSPVAKPGLKYKDLHDKRGNSTGRI
jgi:hypothetical protein